MRLSDLKKRKDAYFKKIGNIRPEGRTRKEIEYIVNRSYEALSKRAKKYIDNRAQISQHIVNMIIVDGDVGNINPYKAFMRYSKDQAGIKRTDFAKRLYRRFREEYPGLYSKYNSYVYRLGYSSADWFFQKAKWTNNGSMVTATVELPQKTTGVVYQELELTVDASGDYFVAEMY